jgi:L-amino acid N-acyltransferase YncA
MHVCAFPAQHGIGSALMQYLMREVAQQVDVMELKVEVKEDTDALLTFYEKFGFEKQNCQCGVCGTLDPNQDEMEHIQMIYRPTDLIGAVTVLDL